MILATAWWPSVRRSHHSSIGHRIPRLRQRRAEQLIRRLGERIEALIMLVLFNRRNEWSGEPQIQLFHAGSCPFHGNSPQKQCKASRQSKQDRV